MFKQNVEEKYVPVWIPVLKTAQKLEEISGYYNKSHNEIYSRKRDFRLTYKSPVLSRRVTFPRKVTKPGSFLQVDTTALVIVRQKPHDC